MSEIWTRLWNTVRRWRTWIVTFIGAALLSPDLMNELFKFNWSTIIPPHYMPYFTIGMIFLHAWMRPRPAVLPHDPEVQIAKARKASEFNGDQV